MNESLDMSLLAQYPDRLP